MKPRKMKSNMMPVFVINFRNVSETESNWRFGKKCENMFTKQESISDAAFMAWPFSSDFNFATKDGQATAASCKYCPLVVGPTVTNCCKELHLKYRRIPRFVFENFAMHKT